MKNLNHLKIWQARDGLKNKEFSALELTNAYIDSIKDNQNLNCFITETFDIAIKDAKLSDSKIASNLNDIGLMEGIPIAHKDLLCTKGVLTTGGSKILDNFVPTYSATVVDKLYKEGACLLGKLNLDQFGMGSANQNSNYPPTKNPWGEGLVAGGSSGGSAAAISGLLVAGATGTDTGGSVRQPAAFCGVVGIKPTYGRCSRYGIIAYASSLDQCGVIAKDVRDSAIMLRAMSGYDAKDSTSANIAVPDFEKTLADGVKGLRVGIPKEYNAGHMPEEITSVWKKAIDLLTEAGAEIIEVSLPHTKYALSAYYIIACAEASSNLARYDGVRYGYRCEQKDLDRMYELTRAEGFGGEVKRRIMMGTYVLSAGFYDAYYLKAQKVRRLVSNDFKEAFKKVDVLVSPITPSAAFPNDENQDDPVKMYLNDIFSVTLNLAGLPGLCLPIELNGDGLPLAVQIIGKPFDEKTVLKASYALEKQANFSAKPKMWGK